MEADIIRVDIVYEILANRFGPVFQLCVEEGENGRLWWDYAERVYTTPPYLRPVGGSSTPVKSQVDRFVGLCAER